MKPGGTSGVPDPIHVPEIMAAHLPDGLLSIVVFGPGKGEAIVVRLPDGSVGVVDGCREPKNARTGKGDPVRELLNQLKPPRLSFVCLTHGHNDHYPGIGKLLNAFKNQVDHVWMSTTMSGLHAEALLEWVNRTRAGKKALPDHEKVDGLEQAITRFNEAYEHYGSQPNLLLAGQSLLEIKTSAGPLFINACGPSSRDILDVQKSLVKAIQCLQNGDRARSDCDLNIASGALLIRWGATRVLLAGDLVQGRCSDSGWRNAAQYISDPVQVVNVAHHASLEAHERSLWAKMSPKLAIVTPFLNATKPHPPRPPRIAKLAGSAVVAITSPPKWKRRGSHPQPLSAVISGPAFKPKNRVLSISTPLPASAIRNAVAVSLDVTGTITQFVLAGQARVYV